MVRIISPAAILAALSLTTVTLAVSTPTPGLISSILGFLSDVEQALVSQMSHSTLKGQTPWNGGKPGWCYSSGTPCWSTQPEGLEYLRNSEESWVVKCIQCPSGTSGSGYTETFSNLTCATQASDYITLWTR
ncbi:hypothetical protein BT96DRAFT_991013 [Gymnopus androsaceus JB14]|uniref:CBM1 domain-containing protein n=1 Tax=Gymnopus androsaceus JB14 TaxID=1447944 RepID=A0A6A4HTN4_9AGAR|nr:hypothetical protein BT96DRAFT_991013 [Gymnopus androsaceus JB14]